MLKIAKDICKKIKSNNGEAYFCGGYVRDTLLGLESKDIDVATNLTPDQIISIFPSSSLVGKSFGVITINFDNHKFDIVTYRKDGRYIDSRHPKSIEFGTMKDDAQRRDFTCNALYQDPETNEIIDLVDGIDDINNKTLKCVGNPDLRFQEDALRLLRAVRFASRFNFKFSDDTLYSLNHYSHLIKNISPERIRDELTSILIDKNASRALDLLYLTGLLNYILPEVQLLMKCEQGIKYHSEGNVYIHTQLALDAIEDRNKITCWGTLLHDIGKPESMKWATETAQFPGHGENGAIIAEKILDRLKFSNDDKDIICYTIKNHMMFHDAKNMKKSTFRKFVGHQWFNYLVEVHKADCIGCRPGKKKSGKSYFLDYINEKIKEFKNEPVLPKSFINGNDLISLGLKPGKQLGNFLKEIYNMQLEGVLLDKEQALEYINLHIKKYLEG